MLCWSQFVAHNTMIQLFFYVIVTSLTTILGIEIYVEKNADLNTVNGKRAELVCEVSGLRDSLRQCEWFSPNGTRYDPGKDLK